MLLTMPLTISTQIYKGTNWAEWIRTTESQSQSLMPSPLGDSPILCVAPQRASRG